MRNPWKVIAGLVFDDWWLFLGVLAAILLSYLGLSFGMNGPTGGWLLTLFILIALILSLSMEYRKKVKQAGRT